MKWTATAEHCGGGSVGHPCRRGVYSDPTDGWEEEVEGKTIKDGERAAFTALKLEVDAAEPCDCERKLSPGCESWWNSVSITLE